MGKTKNEKAETGKLRFGGHVVQRRSSFFDVGEVFATGSGQVVGDDEGGFAMGGECYARINDVTTKRRNLPAVP
jgi:hypothetical protein